MKVKIKQIGFIALLLLGMFAYTCWLQHDEEILTNEDFVRFHVVANSNSTEDQKLKLAVRDGLIEKINHDLMEEVVAVSNTDRGKVILDIDRTKEFLERNLAEFEKEARSILIKSGCLHPVQASLDRGFIPQKTYGNITFPKGTYDALKITIGQGKGENWWCVLFPPLCLIGTKDDERDDVYKDALLNEKYRELIKNDEKPRTLKLKFKIKELLK